MLNETLFRQPRQSGIQVLQQRGRAGARELTTRRLTLEAGGTADFGSSDEETVLVLQHGRGALTAGGSQWTVSRDSVFTERATALYLPAGVPLHVAAQTAFEAVLFSTPAPKGGSPVLATPDEVRVNARGRGNYAREVHDIFVTDPHVRRLMVGETFNPPGHWSSFPPHKHDGRDGEPTLEEVYYFRVDPPQGFGQQMLYTADGETVTHAVRDGDAVLLPYGYHPVSSPPGYRLYYLWGMAGEQRKLALHEDPSHTWIHDAAQA
ncbi:MAG TPA: 5-deoxy-glucuronate isomerase [Vicinamibacterales bacterium]|nr:5-deoxy-glucuronate isomerase [Vicinamibacterales bacterium]